jgi:hypothetical protein
MDSKQINSLGINSTYAKSSNAAGRFRYPINSENLSSGYRYGKNSGNNLGKGKPEVHLAWHFI